MVQPWKCDRKPRLGRSNLNVPTSHRLKGSFTCVCLLKSMHHELLMPHTTLMSKQSDIKLQNFISSQFSRLEALNIEVLGEGFSFMGVYQLVVSIILRMPKVTKLYHSYYLDLATYFSSHDSLSLISSKHFSYLIQVPPLGMTYGDFISKLFTSLLLQGPLSQIGCHSQVYWEVECRPILWRIHPSGCKDAKQEIF